jgi:uncharacterized protein GlcG (DUF336 family)
MRRVNALAGLAVCLAWGSATAQAPGAATPARAKGPSEVLALEAAQAALEDCVAKGYKVSALVVDSAGATVVLLTADGATPRTNAIAAEKTAAVLKYRVSSGEVLKRVQADPAFAAEVKADPKLGGEVRQGGLPMMAGGQIIGAIAVSGGLGPLDKDEICARAGLDRVASRLR